MNRTACRRTRLMPSSVAERASERRRSGGGDHHRRGDHHGGGVCGLRRRLTPLDAEDVFDVEADLPRISAPAIIIGGGKDLFYPRELFEGTAAGIQDGRVHIFEDWGHMRTCLSRATTNLTLGFMLAGAPIRTAH